MTFINAKTLEELKSYGKLSDLRKELKNALGDSIKIKSNSWGNFFNSLQALRIFYALLEENQNDEDFFKSEIDETIYNLTQLEGKVRLKKLGVNLAHYSNKEVAKKWRNDIAKKIHPDKCKHKLATKAMDELSNIYEDMAK